MRFSTSFTLRLCPEISLELLLSVDRALDEASLSDSTVTVDGRLRPCLEISLELLLSVDRALDEASLSDSTFTVDGKYSTLYTSYVTSDCSKLIKMLWPVLPRFPSSQDHNDRIKLGQD
ncbi:hypothetical protein RRG08_022891 [Elysia crispata]|uniref:Uncharacterized protein n=1 Tax=Elysia crispata TaxID=231223 RepID=A0AAE0XND3_9GAST|nr:hypothetical protein RRG08_022891 [Elysia crispata]